MLFLQVNNPTDVGTVAIVILYSRLGSLTHDDDTMHLARSLKLMAMVRTTVLLYNADTRFAFTPKIELDGR